jgi:hypothetical protein
LLATTLRLGIEGVGRALRFTMITDKQRKALGFQEGDQMFMTGVGRALKSRKLTPHFIGRYQILKRIGEVA